MNKYVKVLLWYLAAVGVIGLLSSMNAHDGLMPLPAVLPYIMFVLILFPAYLFGCFHVWFREMERGTGTRVAYFILLLAVCFWIVIVGASILGLSDIFDRLFRSIFSVS